MIRCPDCEAEVRPVQSDHPCEAITCTPGGGHYLCEKRKGHGGKGHAWRYVPAPRAEG